MRILGSGIFATMKKNKRDFAKDYIHLLDSLMPDGKAELRTMTEGRANEAEARARLEASYLRTAWMTMFTEVAAMAGVRDAVVSIEAMIASDDPDAGKIRVDLANRLMPTYRGGLRLALDVMAANRRGHVTGATRPQANDYFDLYVLASVDDHVDTFLVTEEKAWHRVAKLAGYADRVVTWASVGR